MALAALLLAFFAADPTLPAIVITPDAVAAKRSYEDITSGAPATFCAGRDLLLKNKTSKTLQIDLYEAQTDVGFPMDDIAPGRATTIHPTRAARVIAINRNTTLPIAYFVVRECSKRSDTPGKARG